MNVALTDAESHHLRQLQKQQRDDAGYVKVTVILLLDKGRAAGSIADDLGLDDATVYCYAHAWQRLGQDKYLIHEAATYWGLLPSAGLAALSRQVEQALYTDVRAIGAWVQRRWGVTYSQAGLTQLLYWLGFCYKLTPPVPCEADPVRQAAFLAEQLQPLLAAAAAGQAVGYFADAAHPTHNTRSTRVWTRCGQPRPLPTVSGRERVNLNAAVNAHWPTQVHLDPTECVNAQRTQVLCKKMLAAHPGERPIYVICDNAHYYCNKALTEWLADKRLVQVFLPPYSPNLNLIERLLRFLRQKIINLCLYRTKGEFRRAVLGFF